MRDLQLPAIKRHCIESGPDGGAYIFRDRFGPLKRPATLRVIASHGLGWDHVSVSLANRCPTWEEMEYIKRIFFKHDEVAMQLHVPSTEHINCHSYTLHLWRPQNQEIPRPNAELARMLV